jgi:hypothetical protein
MYQKAVDIALAAAEADPGNARALHQLGLSLLYAGQTEDAAKQFSLAMAAGSGSALAGGVVALQLLEAGRTDDARKVFVHQRTGDALACAYAFSAQALLMAGAGEWAEFDKLAEWAEEAWKDIPEALRTTAVTAPLIAARAKVQEARDGHEGGTHADS